MTKINLREHYPNYYKTDYIIEVPDEVAAIMLEYDRLDAAYRRRTYYHKAHYCIYRTSSPMCTEFWPHPAGGEPHCSKIRFRGKALPAGEAGRARDQSS